MLGSFAVTDSSIAPPKYNEKYPTLNVSWLADTRKDAMKICLPTFPCLKRTIEQ